MANVIIGEKKFVESLDGWLFKNEQKYAQWLAQNKSGIPEMFRKHSGELYRGMVIDDDFISSFKNNKLKLTRYTSWTKDKNLAIKFAKSDKYQTKSRLSKQPILITYKVPTTQQILDIENLVLFMGSDVLSMLGADELSLDSAMKEREVLCDVGIILDIKNITYL